MKYILLGLSLLLCIHHVNAQNDTIRVIDLEEVQIQALSRAKVIEQQAIKTTVLDVKAVENQAANLTELMNRTVGVRIRQTGGLGSNANLMLNGFEGRAIKYFKDGIPMDYLGAAFNFSIVPINIIDRIEIYKGVLPISLGADALGGAVNIVTRQDESRKALDLSYQYGSFNTHRGAIHGLWKDTSDKFFVGTDIFYNYSDNNYKASVPVVDPETAVSHKERLPLLHNSFSNIHTEVYGGIKNQQWADELRIGLTYFDIKRDHNYGVTMDIPFGGVTSGMHSFIPTLRYKKDFFDKRIKLDQFIVYNKIHTNNIDTVKGIYDWHGNFTPIPSRNGEARRDGSLTKLKFENLISRSNVKIPINLQHAAELNLVYSQITRIGSNPFGDKFPQSGLDVLSTPAKYNKFIVATGLKSYFLDAKLSNEVLAKLYYANTKGNEGSRASDEEGWVKHSTTRWGIGDAIKYSFSPNAFVRWSGEVTVRLPEQAEYFGDGNFVQSNFALKPERSYNLNLGGYFSTNSSFTVEANIFYRRSTDLILLVNTGVFGKYQNVDKVKGMGTELDLAYSIFPWLKVNGNLTYQDFRLFGQSDPAFKNARLRNTPFFFANVGAHAEFKNLIKKKDKVAVYWNYGFVREYYLNYIPKEYEPDGFLGLWGKPKVNADAITIPNQSLHSVGCSWWINQLVGLTVEAKNIFDAEIFDNYRSQNAGRSFHVKVNYTIR